MSKARQQKKPDHLNELLAALETGAIESVRAILVDLHPADIATLIEGTPPESRPLVWTQVDDARKGETLLELAEDVRADLLRLTDDAALVAAARTLDTDDIADLIPELSDEVIAEILAALDKQNRQRLDAVLSYPEDTAGGLMNVDAITVRENITLEVVLRYLRRRGALPESTDKLFVVDRHDALIGQLEIGRLLTTDPDRRVSQVMDREVIRFPALAPQQDVAKAFEDYDLISAPVVDEHNRLIGRITIDDVVDVLREEAEHSILAPAGLSEDEDIFAPPLRTSRRRSVWLAVNLVTAIIAAAVVGLFESTIEKVVALAVMMPIVAGMGGNAGTQTVTAVIRGLALGIVSESNARRLLTRELAVGALNGLVFALAVGLIAVLWHKNLMLGPVIAMAMVINLTFAALFGVLIPVAVRRLGIDPALASGVILTTVTDVVGFFSFLGLATIFLV
ncbi:magnesium transporter [Sulfurifustis variabilis]|uniref:Magnesium transporter MgtE n=1 Tax=Sulfurifustis variabilis TaxID=1675686 RepID=A0A1B4V1D2_9GAMM|nr:magnesium transporter [Sulfurifustis variabilis]BAU47193.1 magnesium transporter [Sulfurifustis variabilis]